MANLIFDKAQIEIVIDKIVDRTMRMDMTLGLALRCRLLRHLRGV